MLKHKLLPMILLIGIIISSFAQKKQDSKSLYEVTTTHPRVLIDEETEQKITSITQNNPMVANIDNLIIKFADWAIKQPVLQYKLTGIRLLDISRSAFKRIFCLSYAFRRTKQKEYADRAIQEMIAVCKFPDWNPSHFLDVAEMAMGIAIGYDWLYENINSVEKREIVQAIKEKAINPSFDSSNNWYKKLDNNWNPVCNAGIIYTAIVFYEEFPDLAKTLIIDCLESNRKAIAKYNPDGGYPEGYSYWDYGTMFQVLMIDALERNFGTDFNLITSDNFYKTGRYIQFMIAPSNLCFNYSDSPAGTNINIPLFWFAEKTNDSSLIFSILKSLSNSNEVKEVAKSRFIPLIPICLSRLIDFNPKVPNTHFWISMGITPVYIYRGGWENKTDSYLGVKGGSASTIHAHMDAGSFIYEYNGERWACDLGMPNYNFVESKGIKLWDSSQDGDRWNIMRMRNDCHNTLTVNNEKHNVNGNARIIYTFTTNERKGCVVDLSNTLPKIRKAHREVSLDKYDYLSVIDSIENFDEDIRLFWTMITSADAKITNEKTIILDKNNKRMILSFETNYQPTPYVETLTPIHEYDEPIKELSRVGFSIDIPAHSKNVLKARIFQPDSI